MADDIQSPALPDVPLVDNSADAFPSFRGHNQGAELLAQAIGARDLQGTEHYLKAMADKGFETKAAETMVASFAGRANAAAWHENGTDAIFPVKLIKALAKVPAIEAEAQKSPQVLLRALEEKKWGLGQMLLNRGYGPANQVERFMRFCLEADKPVLIEKFDALHPGETAKVMGTVEGERLLSYRAHGESAARYLLDNHHPDSKVDPLLLESVATHNVTALRLLHERGHALPPATLAKAATMPRAGLFETLGSAENQAFLQEHYLPPLARRMSAFGGWNLRIRMCYAVRKG